MTISTVPPQAYTQDTMKQAFAWLQAQPAEFRNSITNPDQLVLVYLRAKRGGESSSSKSASAQVFSSELKSLAKEMNQFDPQHSMQQNMQTSQGLHQGVSYHAQQQPLFIEPKEPIGQAVFIDTNTHALLEEVRSQLNLSSEAESLRMLVRLGFERVKAILPS